MSSKNPYWPFNSREAFEEYEELRARGYNLLREAHIRWLKALTESRTKK